MDRVGAGVCACPEEPFVDGNDTGGSCFQLEFAEVAIKLHDRCDVLTGGSEPATWALANDFNLREVPWGELFCRLRVRSAAESGDAARSHSRHGGRDTS